MAKDDGSVLLLYVPISNAFFVQFSQIPSQTTLGCAMINFLLGTNNNIPVFHILQSKNTILQSKTILFLTQKDGILCFNGLFLNSRG